MICKRIYSRFQSGMVNPDNDIGFKAVWTAVTLTEKGETNECFFKEE